MSSSHDHLHSHALANFGKAFAIGIALNVIFIVIEAFYGSWSHSLALLADAGHNLSDVLGLGLAWGASVLVRQQPSPTKTYGYRRSTILAALFNAIFLLVAVGGIAFESIQRFGSPSAPSGVTVMMVAAVGIAVNGVTALLFLSGRNHDLNIKGAFTHMAADVVVSLGVVGAGFMILLTHWEWIDPLVSLIVSAVIVVGTWDLLRDSVNLALDAVPEGINLDEVQTYLHSIESVTDVHDVHVWAVSTTETALTAHVVMEKPSSDALISKICGELHQQFGIEHSTLQIEQGDPAHPCSCSLT